MVSITPVLPDPIIKNPSVLISPEGQEELDSIGGLPKVSFWYRSSVLDASINKRVDK